MSDSSSTGTSFVLILLALGGGMWLVQQAFTEPPKPVPAAPVEEASSTASRSLDYSKTNGDAMNNSVNDQLKSVQQMTGGSYDGQTFVLPKAKK
ncbi:hypothetical protein [Prosthecobacter sp.]|uniref:hypothetical protein n=1 Tax=Prosthecobacter sp. TaxID=1965333 RepID=UPI0037851E0B